MTNFEAEPYCVEELFGEFNRLFPQRFAGRDVEFPTKSGHGVKGY